jgi:predicted DNA-binding protein
MPSSKAPDARASATAGIAKGNKRQISLTIAPELLRKVDEVAKRTGQARAAVINLAIFRAIKGDFFR